MRDSYRLTEGPVPFYPPTHLLHPISHTLLACQGQRWGEYVWLREADTTIERCHGHAKEGGQAADRILMLHGEPRSLLGSTKDREAYGVPMMCGWEG